MKNKIIKLTSFNILAISLFLIQLICISSLLLTSIATSYATSNDELSTGITLQDNQLICSQASPIFKNVDGTACTTEYNKVELKGNDLFAKCQKYSKEKWKDLVKKKTIAEINNSFMCAWKHVVDECMSDDGVAPSKKNLTELKAAFQKCLTRAIQRHRDIQVCIGLAAMMDEDSLENKPGDTSVSFDKKIKCKSYGSVTQDYNACDSAVKAYDGFFLAQQAQKGIQEAQTIKNQMDTMDDLATSTDKQTGALQAQEDAAKHQSDMARDRAALSGAKATAFATACYLIPSKSDIRKRCQEKLTSSDDADRPNWNCGADKITNAQVFKRIVLKTLTGQEDPSATNLTAGSGSSSSAASDTDKKRMLAVGLNSLLKLLDDNVADICETVIESFHVVANQAAKKGLLQAAAKAGVETISNTAKAVLLKDHADKLKDARKKVQSYKPPNFEFGDAKDALVQLCQVEPDHPQCAGVTDVRTRGFTGNVLTFGGDTSRAYSEGLNADEDGIIGAGDDGTGDGTSRRSGLPGKLGSIVHSGNVPDRLKAGVPGAARAKAGGHAPGGGGGGGGGGGMAAPGGGRGGGGAGGGGGKRGAAVRGVKAAYSGGGGATAKYSGGGIKRRPKKKVDNPFAGLFGKKGGGKAGGVMGFGRNPASIGSKGRNLFDVISKRYNKVSTEKRLLEYEITDKK